MSNISFIIVSVFLLITSIYFYKKPNRYSFTIFFYFISVISSFLLLIFYSISDYFTGNGIDDATIYHLKYGLEGAGFLEYKGLIIVTLSLLILGIFFLFWFLLKRKKKSNYSYISYIFVLLSIIINPALYDIYNALNIDYSVSDEFYKYYKKPYIKQIKDNTKNLVFIYAESFEQTYFNQKVFPNLVTKLRTIDAKTISFLNIKQVPGNGYTIGGIVNSQLGIPLVTSSFANSMSGMDQYLPSAVGFGDLLREEGYHLAFYGGAKLSFAGKGKFFKTHGFDEVMGYNELFPKLLDKSYLNGWGLYDDTLLDIVYDRFLELSKGEKKFCLFTLTLDTHHPSGHISKSCRNLKYKDGANPILNAIACSDKLITKFINKIVNSQYAKNTIIVLASDHIALKNTASDLLKSRIVTNGKRIKIRRSNLFMIIDPSNKQQTQYEETNILGSNFDIGITILPFIGYSGHIGLGRNLLFDKNDETSIDEYFMKNRDKYSKSRKEKKRIFRKFRKWKGTVMKFWDFPKIKNSLTIDPDNKIIKLDKRQFKLPILIVLDEQFNSTLKFQFDGNETHRTLIEELYRIKDDKYFLLIDKGNNINKINEHISGEDFYLIIGKGKNYYKMIKITDKIIYSNNKILKLLNLSL